MSAQQMELLSDSPTTTHRHKVYMRDWYFNAGIVGFLEILLTEEEKSEINIGKETYSWRDGRIVMAENYIEFENTVLEDFDERYNKTIFEHFYNIDTIIGRAKIPAAIEKLKGDETDIKKIPKIEKKIEDIFKNEKPLNTLLHYKLKGAQTKEDLEQAFNKYKTQISTTSISYLYNHLKSTQEGNKKLNDIVVKYSNFNTKLEDLKKASNEIVSNKVIQTDKNIDFCSSCHKNKAKFNLNKSLSRIIGSNYDNTNWYWNFNEQYNRLCPICALVSGIAFISFFTIKTTGKYIKYFINSNQNIRILFNTHSKIRLQVNALKQEKSFHLMLIKIFELLASEQVKSLSENISFVEMEEGIGSYKIRNFQIPKRTVEFIKDIGIKNVPKGSLIINNQTTQIRDLLLSQTINNHLNFALLNNLFQYKISFINVPGADKKKSNIQAYYSTKHITDYFFKYLTYMEENVMPEKPKIIGKAYLQGKELRAKIKKNQVNGYAYAFLNALKIADQKDFLDKYFRAMIGHEIRVSFGQEEMNNKEDFLKFGYSFINGLLYEKFDSTQTNKE